MRWNSIAEMDQVLGTIVLLKHARKTIDSGWCQSTEKNRTEDGWQYCAWAAIKRSTSNVERWFRSRIIIEQHVLDGANLLGFNDELGRTKEEVLDVFDQAIDFVTQEISQHIQDNAANRAINATHTSCENDSLPGSP